MPEDSRAPKQIKVKSLDDYLEVMSKAVFQSGMSWKVIESKWPGTREAFSNFAIKKVADFDERDFERLNQDTRVVRNYRKLMAVSHNARKILALDKQHGSFKKYLRSFEDFEHAIMKMREDFKFMGPFGIYYFLYVVGEDVPTHEEFRKKYGKN
jgi:DNA-3-methyladenine glycosylase I